MLAARLVRRSATTWLRASRSLSASAITSAAPALSDGPLVVGCGSNVVDVFFEVEALPSAGGKYYFRAPKDSSGGIEAGQVVGGVTLNHLAWAAAMGAPSALLARQGTCDRGKMIRREMLSRGLDPRYVDVSPSHTTSLSHILLEPSGERSIIMAPAATSTITEDVMSEWTTGTGSGKAALGDRSDASPEAAVARARPSVVTTEISQLPMAAAARLLEAGREIGALTVLDVDVPPSVALGEANLGNKEDLLRVLQGCSLLKLTKDAAPDLLRLAGDMTSAEALERLAGEAASADQGTSQELATQTADVLRRRFGASVCAVTDGSRGSALAGECATSGAQTVVYVPAVPVAKQRDATGAGDAYLGGLVAYLAHQGVPQGNTPEELESQLRTLGTVGSAAGAACCEVLGALPPDASHGGGELLFEVLRQQQGAVGKDHPIVTRMEQTAAAMRKDAVEPSRTAWLEDLERTWAGDGQGASHGDASAPDGGRSNDKDAGFREKLQQGENSFARPVLGSLQNDAAAAASIFGQYAADFQNADGSMSARIAIAAHALGSCRAGTETGGAAWVLGVGKSGRVGERLAVSLRSMGLRCSAVNANELYHGDFGAIGQGDVCLVLSQSGGTKEAVAALGHLENKGAHVVLLVGAEGSAMEVEARRLQELRATAIEAERQAAAGAPAGSSLGASREVSAEEAQAMMAARSAARRKFSGRFLLSTVLTSHAPTEELLGVAPTRSVVVQEMVANALVTSVAELVGRQRDDFLRDHPGGGIGSPVVAAGDSSVGGGATRQ